MLVAGMETQFSKKLEKRRNVLRMHPKATIPVMRAWHVGAYEIEVKWLLFAQKVVN